VRFIPIPPSRARHVTNGKLDQARLFIREVLDGTDHDLRLAPAERQVLTEAMRIAETAMKRPQSTQGKCRICKQAKALR
jgi:hypothetical protein